jgi:prepilin-type N-terminal cleavage/methylation domain-containing protein
VARPEAEAGRPRAGSGEGGVTLMEIIVALAILSVVLISLGGLMFQVSQQTRRATAMSYLGAALQSEQTRIEGLPWDSLAAAAGCASASSGRLTYTRCTTVTTVTAQWKQIRVVLVPTGNLTAPPETLVVYRVKPRIPSPFNR